MAISENTPTKTSAVSYCPRATLIRKPNPRSGAMNSPTTAPITESVAPIFSPPSRTGSAAGSSRWRKFCQRVASSERINSRRLAETERKPITVLTSTGKKTISAQISTFEAKPLPSQMKSSGAIATTGMAWVATMYGARICSASRDLLSRYPSSAAVPTPAPIPASTSPSVNNECRIRLPSARTLPKAPGHRQRSGEDEGGHSG